MNPIGLRPYTLQAPRFGKHISQGHYDPYYTSPAYNGVNADPFLVNIVAKLFPKGKACLWDIGAGDGRNIVSILAMGNKTNTGVASEMSSAACNIITDRIQSFRLQGRLAVDNLDILDMPQPGKRCFNFAMMARVSQHFNEEELAKAMANINSRLKRGGYFAFDALVRNSDHRKSTPLDEENGEAHFRLDTIRKMAMANGFRLEACENFTKPAGYNPDYLNDWNNAEITHQWILLKKVAQPKLSLGARA